MHSDTCMLTILPDGIGITVGVRPALGKERPLSLYHPSTAQFSRVSGYSAGIKFLLSNAILKIPHCRPLKLQLLICDDPESDERYNGQGVSFCNTSSGRTDAASHILTCPTGSHCPLVI